MENFKIIKTGTLKYDNIKSMSVLKNELKSYGIILSPKEIKVIFYDLLNNQLNYEIDLIFKRCIDQIFDKTEYEKIEDEEIYEEEHNFPDNWIAPTGYTFSL